MGPSVKFHSHGSPKSGDSSRVGSPAKRATGSTTVLVKALMGSQITGRGLKSLRQLPPVVLHTRFEATKLASLCMDFETVLASNHVEACQRALSNLHHLLSDPHHKQIRESFVVFGGDVLLLRALFYPFAREDGVEKSASSKVLSVRRDCLSLLHQLCVTVPFFAEGLAADGEFLIQLFAFMYFTATFDQAVGLAEDVLAARADILRVQDIPDFTNLVRSFSSRQLASFCRVLAMVTFEPEARNPWMEQEDWSAEKGFQPMQKKPTSEEPDWSVADQNHDVILLIPDILARLLQLLTFYQVSFNREGVSSSSEGSEWTATVYVEGGPLATGEEGRSGGALPDQSRSFHPFAEGRPRADASLMDEDLLDWNLFLDRTSSTTALLLSHHVEVLFVLCALCGGKKREQVQNCLAELGLVGVLNDMFDKLDWMVTQSRGNTRGIHGYGCACNPKSALKIQYLRLIHNFCDRDSCNRANKQLLLQPSSSKDGSFIWNKNAEHKEPRGLIMKILKVLINEPADSLYRFWLASCVEAFLRGADSKDQEFVASKGLMEHLVHEILKGGFRCATLLQINFDLLGELIKFNKTLFRELDRLLAGDKFNQFVEVLVTNLVDSNVFVRSVVLSLDYFQRSQQSDNISNEATFACSLERQQATMSSDRYNLGSAAGFRKAKGDDEFSMITAFVAHNTHRLLRDLMCAVQLSDINQDNICVLNTALIFFIFAEKNGELQGYLQTLRAGNMRVLQTFRALLEFWRSYYLWKPGRECASLQYSTQLPFSDWLQIVDCLCAHPDSLYSLLHTSSPVATIPSLHPLHPCHKDNN